MGGPGRGMMPGEKPKDFKNSIGKLVRYLGRYWYSTMERLSEKARMRNYCTIAKFTSRLPGASCLPKNWDFLRR